MAEPPFPLYQRYPQLEAKIPRLSLTRRPTPVERLEKLGARIGCDHLWIKRDSVSGTIYGGNKPRKLEFILADALAGGIRTIITFGGLATNHGLATALYGREHGLRTALLLVHQPVDDHVRQQILRLHQAGATLHYTVSSPRTRLLAPLFFLRYAEWRRRKPPYFLPPGGSTPLGTLGFVNAAFELAEQAAAGECPQPEHIVVALGSNGTAAGLLLGLRLAGLPSRLVAVQISDIGTLSPASVVGLANRAADLLRRRGAALPPNLLKPSDVTVVSDWLGPGYGHHTAAGERAQALLAETEDLTLDPTYTAKTMAAVLGMLEDGRLGDGPVLYWHTYNALPLPEPDLADFRQLPGAFHRFFESPPEPSGTTEG
jgi:D-cysteine desulfhydrase